MDDTGTQELRLEDERALLHALAQNDGFKLFQVKWSKLLKECESSLRSQENPNRDWAAGLVEGYHRLLGYVDKRIATIDKELAKRSLKQAD